MTLKFYTSVAKGLKLKVRKSRGLIPVFVEVTGEKLVGRGEGDTYCPSPSIIVLKNKNYKYITSISKLDNIVNEYNNKYHIAIKIKSIDLKSSTYIGFNVKNKDKVLNDKVNDNVNFIIIFYIKLI